MGFVKILTKRQVIIMAKIIIAPEEELYEVIDFCIRVGLPVTLAELGMTEVKEEEIMAVAEATAAPTDTCHNNMPFELTAKDVFAAILEADAIGKSML